MPANNPLRINEGPIQYIKHTALADWFESMFELCPWRCNVAIIHVGPPMNRLSVHY